MQVHGSQVRRAYSLWRSGTSQLVDQGLLGLTPLGEGLLSPKTCLTQFTTKQLVHSSFITCSNIFEGQQAEENRKLKAISSQRRAPEFPCPFRSAPTRL